MKIKLNPLAGKTVTTIEVVDENQLIYNGETVDFSSIPSGGDAEADYPFYGKISKDENGIVSCELAWKYDSNNCTMSDRFPAPVEMSSGVVVPMEDENV